MGAERGYHSIDRAGGCNAGHALGGASGHCCDRWLAES